MSDTQTPLNRWQRWVLRLSKWLFCIVLGIVLADLTWRMVAPEPLYLMPPSQGSGAAKRVGANVQGTAQYHAFGIATDDPVDVKKVIDAPETRLQLQLLGVTVADSPEYSSAIIAPKGGRGEFYPIDGKVQGGATLKEVHSDRVILSNRGKLETLKFEKRAGGGVTARAVARPVNTVRSTGDLQRRIRQVRSPSEFINLAKQELNANPQGVLRELGLSSAGGGQGYRVESGSILTSLNLRPGDVVLSVNNQRLGDINADQVMLEDVVNSGSVRLEIQRGNQRFVVNHNIK